MKRTLNGELLKLRGSKKLWTRIVCQDLQIPDMLALEIGQIVDIGCIVRLWKKVTPCTTVNLKRLPCAHSVRGHDAVGKVICRLNSHQVLDIPPYVAFISYRPHVHMMITKIDVTEQEWGKGASWTLEAEEV